MTSIVKYLNQKYGKVIKLELKHQYYNMRHMREAILVAVPCRTNDISGMPGTSEFARLWEYLPSTDTLVTTELQGLGEKYADFLINNVKPTLDYITK